MEIRKIIGWGMMLPFIILMLAIFSNLIADVIKESPEGSIFFILTFISWVIGFMVIEKKNPLRLIANEVNMNKIPKFICSRCDRKIPETECFCERCFKATADNTDFKTATPKIILTVGFGALGFLATGNMVGGIVGAIVGYLIATNT